MFPKEECEELMAPLFYFAEEQLKKHREFYPFGAVMLTDGKIELTAEYDGNEHPEAKEVLAKLTAIHKEMAEAGKIKVSGIAWNAPITHEGKTSDAVVMSLEHKDGYSVIVVDPYRIGWFKKVHFDELFAMEGKKEVFA